MGFWRSLTMKITWDHWTEKPQKLSLRVVDEKLAERMVLDGGFSAGVGNGSIDARIKASTSRSCAILNAAKQRDRQKTTFSLEQYVRSGGDRKASWVSSQEDGGVLPKRISLNCSGGRVHAWRGEAPSYEVNSPSVANKARRDDLLGFVSTTARIPKNPDMATYGNVREVGELGIEPKLMSDASEDELALFLGILTDFFWSRGYMNIVPPPAEKMGAAM